MIRNNKNDMNENYIKLRLMVFDYLRKNQREQLNLVQGGNFKNVFDNCGIEMSDTNLEIIQQIFHELYLERVIMTGSSPHNITNAMSWPFYRVTEYGKKVLNEESYIPHDPDGYLERIQQAIPNLDQIISMYLEEALGCFRAGFMFAASVMLGCAAERAMLLLIEKFGEAISDSKERDRYKKETETRWIKHKYTALWKRLEKHIPTLPKDLSDDLHTILDRIFDLIRVTRNEAGHPTGKKVERETVYANVILFPSYCRRVYGLLSHFQNK